MGLHNNDDSYNKSPLPTCNSAGRSSPLTHAVSTLFVFYHTSMLVFHDMAGLFKSFWNLLVDVLLFWQIRFFRWLTRRKPVEVWFDILRDAKVYEEWEEAAYQLDVLLGNDLWYMEPRLLSMMDADARLGARTLPPSITITVSSMNVSSQSS